MTNVVIQLGSGTGGPILTRGCESERGGTEGMFEVSAWL
jgi:hypothetical protein